MELKGLSVVTIDQAKRVLDVVDAGLCRGIGTPVPGHMCVEAAVCYALGLPHGDNPACVCDAVRQVKIALNDSYWSGNSARAAGLRRLAVAQLGSDIIDGAVFLKKLSCQLIRVIVPIALRAAAKVQPTTEQQTALETSAVSCAAAGNKVAAAGAAAGAAAYAAAYAAHAAGAAADAARAARAAGAAADAAAYAAHAASYAAHAAADAAVYTARAAGAELDKMLTITAELVIDVLREIDAPGIVLMDGLF